jgi:dephospho-CoA kinase
MLRVGLTGGIGSGKSTVAAQFARHGATVVDADQIAREVVAPGSPGLAAVASRFGPTVLGADGSLDRAALAAVVFADTAALRDLEAITHPLIFARSRMVMAAGAAGIVVHDHPLLVEKSMGAEYHLVVVVDAPVETRVARLVGRGLTAGDARARIAAQASYDERLAAADVWLDNSGAFEGAAEQVERLWANRLAPYEANLQSSTRVKRPEMTTLADPDPGWAARGARVAARISHALAGRATDVEHIGSTAVPSLPAKDVVDVQVGIRQLAAADEPGFVAAMRAAGYVLEAGRGRDHPHPADAPPDGWRKRFYGGCDQAVSSTSTCGRPGPRGTGSLSVSGTGCGRTRRPGTSTRPRSGGLRRSIPRRGPTRRPRRTGSPPRIRE